MEAALLFSLKGKVAMVTGAGRGIGRTIRLAFAEAGADLAIGARTDSEVESTAEEIRKTGCQAITHHLDVSSLKSIGEFVKRIVDEFGRIDILVNNAGVPIRKSAVEITEGEWDWVMDVNLKGLFFCTQECARYMIRQGGGKVINIASAIGLVAFAGQSAYCVSKAAVIHMTRVLGVEWAPYRINVNAIAPYSTRTTLGRDLPDYEEVLQERARTIPMGRVLNTDDLVGAAIFLASSVSDFITGQTIVVDGGFTVQ
jgi:2-deoxy-D-gluconate 3-dehydrogenase